MQKVAVNQTKVKKDPVIQAKVHTEHANQPKVKTITTTLSGLGYTLKEIEKRETAGTLPPDGNVTFISKEEKLKGIKALENLPNRPDCSTYGYAKSTYEYSMEKTFNADPVDDLESSILDHRFDKIPTGFISILSRIPYIGTALTAGQIYENGVKGYYEHRKKCDYFDAAVGEFEQKGNESFGTVTYTDKK
ncbi:MAG: hypothetical protein H0W50_11185 [Parachlamydiaceae bacterium]|nr:hypothetical protein [Parachlamydiaceae bacterium]